MAMAKINNDIAALKEPDIYSLILFSLFKLRDLPEYSALSELAYILDKDNLLKLCEYFGGTTLKIPTIDELESLVYCLVLYQYINIENKSYDDAVKLISNKCRNIKQVKCDYKRLSEILKNYEFKSR